MIAHKIEDLPHSEINVTTTHDDNLTEVISLHPSLSETSSQLQESIGDLRGQIAQLQSTIVDLQNAVKTISLNSRMKEQDLGRPSPRHRQNFLSFLIDGGDPSGTNWDILEWYPLILFLSVIVTLSTILVGQHFGHIEPRDDLKYGYAFGVLLIGGVLMRVVMMLKASILRRFAKH